MSSTSTSTDAQKLKLLKTARKHLHQTTRGFLNDPGSEWKAAEQALDLLEAQLTPVKPQHPVPNLGPVIKNGKAVLLQDCTHLTGGVPHYPAFDDGVGHPGMDVIAPEGFTVTKIGRFVRRDGKPNGKSVYGTGVSGIKWVFGHLEQVPVVGEKVNKGVAYAVISANHEAPHIHVGIDARALLGHDLDAHDNYTHGAIPIGIQLAAALL